MYAVAKSGKSGSIFFGPNRKYGPWHRSADHIKSYRSEEKASSVAARAGGFIVPLDHAMQSCGAVFGHPDMLG